MHFHLSLMVWCYIIIKDSISKKNWENVLLSTYMRSSGASELRTFRDFHIVKLLFPSIFLLVLQILCLRIIFNFKCQITYAYIYNQRSFLLYFTYGMGLYINNSIPTNTNMEQNNVCICEQAERASLENFGIFTF